MNSDRNYELETVIDLTPISRLQIVVIALCAVAAMLDGFDTQAIAFAAPEIASAWRVEVSAFGAVFGIGLFGGLIGAIIFGPVGDRFGRKPALLFTVALFAVGSLVTPAAESLSSLSAIRFATGLGLGGAVPNFMSLGSEYLPKRLRSTLVSLMFCGFPLGAVIGGVASAKLILAFGWKSVFFAGGIVPLAVLPLFVAFVPESVRFLAMKGQHVPVAKILIRMKCAVAWNGETNAEPASTRAPIASLFADGRAGGTLLIWTSFFFSLLLTYFLLNWIPIIVTRAGLGIEDAVIAVVMGNLGGVAGCLVIGRLADRLGQARVIGCGFALGALAVALIGFVEHSRVLLFATVFMAGFLSLGAQMCTVALCACFYETYLRATGIGCSIGVGRVGAVVGPVLGGMLIASGVSSQVLFSIAGLASLGSAIAVFAIGKLVVRSASPRFVEVPKPVTY